MARSIKAASSTADVEFESGNYDVDTEPTSTTAPKSKVVRMKKTNGAAGKPKVAKAAKSAKSEKVASPPKFIGRTSGLRVQEFQNKLMKDNYRAKLTDEQLAKAMRDEFPAAVPYTTDHVSGIRTAWNKGKRTGQDGPPAKTLTAFDADGNAITRAKPVPPKAKAKKVKA